MRGRAACIKLIPSVRRVSPSENYRFSENFIIAVVFIDSIGSKGKQHGDEAEREWGEVLSLLLLFERVSARDPDRDHDYDCYCYFVPFMKGAI